MRKILNTISFISIIIYLILRNFDYFKKILVDEFGNNSILLVIYMLLISISIMSSLISLIIYYNQQKIKFISLLLFVISVYLMIYLVM